MRRQTDRQTDRQGQDYCGTYISAYSAVTSSGALLRRTDAGRSEVCDFASVSYSYNEAFESVRDIMNVNG